MRLDEAFHALPEGGICWCSSRIFPAWRVRIARVDGACVCTYYGGGHKRDVAALPEDLRQRLMTSDTWTADFVKESF